jgi:hypothetical protein
MSENFFSELLFYKLGSWIKERENLVFSFSLVYISMPALQAVLT